jgi:hypothetical protein
MSITAFYVQHAGSDLMVVNSARVSFGKRSEMEDDFGGHLSSKKMTLS